MKHVPKSYDDQLSNEPLNIKNAHKLGEECTNKMYPSSSTPILLWPWIGEQKLIRSARQNMFLKPMIISFQMSHWTLKAPKNRARNEPIHVILLLHLPWLFWSRIGNWKPLQLAERSRHLKGTIVSFQINTQTLKTPKNWVRTNLCNVYMVVDVASSSWYSNSTVVDSW